MLGRLWLAIALLLGSFLVACGSGATGGGPLCNEGEFSMPNAVGDPCPLVGTDCANAQRLAVATCTPDGVWGECKCQESGGDGSGGGGSSTGTCGNGVRDGNEQCDGSDLGGGSCSMMNGTGTVLCDPAACVYDFSMCTTSGSGGHGGS
jgi:hypothetical protein